MLGFTPFKRHANKFNYIPRYFDPEKEAREQRRAELRGQRSEDAEREYAPGQYIRTQRAARAARCAERDGQGRVKIWKMAGGTVLILLFIYLLYPRLANVFIQAQTTPQRITPQTEEFDPYAPIVVVPNDYTEE